MIPYHMVTSNKWSQLGRSGKRSVKGKGSVKTEHSIVREPNFQLELAVVKIALSYRMFDCDY